jgi:carbon monoxide dehydrogenase subunit G
LQTLDISFDVALPIDEVYRAVGNIGEFGYVLAGVKEVTMLDEDRSEWKVEVRAGMIAQTLTLQGQVTERQPPRLLAFASQGKNVQVRGRIELSATEPAVTVCRVAVEAEVTGRLAPIVDLISRTTQKQMIAQTIENFRLKLAQKAAE